MIERVSSLSTTSGLATEWRDLYSKSGQDNLFLTFDWTRIWLEHFGMRRHVALLHRAHDHLAAVGLFEFSEARYSFIGNEHSAWPGILSLPSEQIAFAPFLDHIANNSDASSVLLCDCPRTQAYSEQLQRAAHGAFVCTSRSPHCTRAIELCGSLDAYLSLRPGKIRMELRRKVRKFARDLPAVAIRSFRDGESADTVMAVIAEIESDSWKATRGNPLSKCTVQSGFYRSVYELSHPDTGGRFFLLESDQKPVAFVIGVVHRSRFYALKTAYKESFSAQSPGLVLFTHVIDELSRREPGVRVIELLGGDARWKQELASSTTELCDYELLRATTESHARAFVANHVRPAIMAAVTRSPQLRDALLKARDWLSTPPPANALKPSKPSADRPTNILGLNYGIKDSSACVVSNGKLLCAVEEKRFSRQLHTAEFPGAAIKHCLSIARLDINEIDHVAISTQPALEFSRRLTCALAHPVLGAAVLRDESQKFRLGTRDLALWYGDYFPIGKHRPRLHFVPHHLAHVAGSFLASPHDDAALLSLSDYRECVSTWIGHGAGCHVKCFTQTYCPMSLAVFYAAATGFCGFRPKHDQGKTMDLVPHGDPNRFYDKVSELVHLDEMARVVLDLSYFDHHCGGSTGYSRKFLEAFGVAREPEGEVEQHHKDVAAAFQRVLEERILTICNALHQRSGSQTLVLEGWLALDSLVTGRIAHDSGFRDLYLAPGLGDVGTCIGAAFYLHSAGLGLGRGEAYSKPQVGDRLWR